MSSVLLVFKLTISIVLAACNPPPAPTPTRTLPPPAISTPATNPSISNDRIILQANTPNAWLDVDSGQVGVSVNDGADVQLLMTETTSGTRYELAPGVRCMAGACESVAALAILADGALSCEAADLSPLNVTLKTGLSVCVRTSAGQMVVVQVGRINGVEAEVMVIKK